MSRRTMPGRPAGVARRWLVGAALSLIVAGGLSSPVAAQRSRDRPRTPEERAELEQRFRARMDRMVQERLGLDESEGEALSEVTQRFDQRRRVLGQEEAMARRQVEELMASDDGDDAQARALLDRLVTLRNDESALFAEEQAALLEVLTPVQVLELHDFRRELGQRIRALRNRDDGEPRNRRRGGDESAYHDHTPTAWSGGVPDPGRLPPHVPGGNVDGHPGVGLLP